MGTMLQHRKIMLSKKKHSKKYRKCNMLSFLAFFRLCQILQVSYIFVPHRLATNKNKTRFLIYNCFCPDFQFCSFCSKMFRFLIFLVFLCCWIFVNVLNVHYSFRLSMCFHCEAFLKQFKTRFFCTRTFCILWQNLFYLAVVSFKRILMIL